MKKQVFKKTPHQATDLVETTMEITKANIISLWKSEDFYFPFATKSYKHQQIEKTPNYITATDSQVQKQIEHQITFVQLFS